MAAQQNVGYKFGKEQINRVCSSDAYRLIKVKQPYPGTKLPTVKTHDPEDESDNEEISTTGNFFAYT